ncbi:MAG: hypothetical protein BAJATHORv1_40336 [Candidatus Thorarchaeota archaeon]|nr:MAG: hypothetical protein BAJATHORv1_40336 [Candidatus Thorarchaeota archaeon]
MVMWNILPKYTKGHIVTLLLVRRVLSQEYTEVKFYYSILLTDRISFAASSRSTYAKQRE